MAYMRHILASAAVMLVVVSLVVSVDTQKQSLSGHPKPSSLPAPREVLEMVANASGASIDIVKLIVLLLASSPLALPLAHFPAVLIHIYSIATSTFFLTMVLDLRWGLVQLVGASLVTWVLVQQGKGLAEEARHRQANGDAKVPPKSTGSGKRMPWIIFFLVMAHLIVNHSKRIFGNIPLDTVEITGSHMVLVMKLTMFAWNVYDGQRPLSELDSYQASTRVTQMPNILEFLGYCLFFPGLLVGPAFTFAQYRAYTSGTLFADEKLNGRIPPGRLRKAGQKLMTGFVFLGVYALYGGSLSYEQTLTPSFLQKTWYQRFMHLMMAGFTARTKYYIVWSFSEAAFTISGAGYNSVTGRWTAGKNINIPSLELAQNYKGVFDNWNMNTNVWLRECIYKRVAQAGKKPGEKSTMATFATSAVWHGPQAGYFFAFIHGGFLQSLGRHIRSTIRPLFLPPGSLSAAKGVSTPWTPLKLVYDVICVLVVQSTLNYLVIPFMLLEVSPTLEAYRRMGWYGHIVTFVPLTFYWTGGGKILKTFIIRRDAAAGSNGTVPNLKKHEEKVDKTLGTNSVAGINSIAPVVAVT